MASQRNALRTGIFMIISVAMVIFVIISISGAGRFTQSFNTYSVGFTLQDDIGGLRVGDDVRIGGLKVGSIRNIRIQPETSSLVVFIELPSRFPIGKNAGVAVQKSITGAAAINIDNLGTGPLASVNDLIPGRPDALSSLFHGLGAMEPDLRETVANLKVASTKLNTDLDKFGTTADAFSETGFTTTETVRSIRLRLPDLIDHYKDAAGEAVSALRAVREFVGPGSTDFRTTLHNLQNITSDLRTRLPGLMDQMHTILAKVDIATGRLDGATADLQGTLANTKDLTGAARSVLTNNKSKLDGIIASLKSTSDNLKFASVEIRHSPWRLLYQPKPDEVANLNIYDSVRQFAEGADSLDDAAAALRDASKDKNADPEQVKRLMNQLDASFAKFQDVEKKLWTEIKP